MSTSGSVTRLSELMNLTPRRVQQLVKEGLPKGKRGEYVLEECMAWYIRYLQAKLAAGQPETSTGELSGRERVDLAKAVQEELKTAEMLKQMVSVSDFDRAMADLITPARHELLALEAKLRPKIGPDHAAVVGVEVKRALRNIGAEPEEMTA